MKNWLVMDARNETVFVAQAEDEDALLELECMNNECEWMEVTRDTLLKLAEQIKVL